MTDDAKQEREGVNVEWLAQQLLDWPDKRTDETKTMAIGTLHRMASATLLSLYREVAALRQPQTDALKKARDALENAPIIGLTESAVDFRKRQDLWAYGQWKAAIKALKESK
jgi:hypothetical protein